MWTKPGIDSDLFLFSIAQATVIRDADVPLQLWDLVEELVLSKVPDILCLTQRRKAEVTVG